MTLYAKLHHACVAQLTIFCAASEVGSARLANFAASPSDALNTKGWYSDYAAITYRGAVSRFTLRKTATATPHKRMKMVMATSVIVASL